MDGRGAAQLAASALAGAAVSAAAFYYLYRAPESKPGGPGGPVPRAGGAAAAGAAAAPPPCAAAPHSLADFEADDILSEQLTRNVQFFGAEAQRRIGGAFVVVVGLGVSGGASHPA
jgi:hypothetical protein